MTIKQTARQLSDLLIRHIESCNHNQDLIPWIRIIGTMDQYDDLSEWEFVFQNTDIPDEERMDEEKDPLFMAALEVFEFARCNLYGMFDYERTVEAFHEVTKVLSALGVENLPKLEEVDISEW